MNERHRNLLVKVSSFNSIHNFHVVEVKHLKWLPAIQLEINSDETIAEAKKLKPHSPKIGDIILALKDLLPCPLKFKEIKPMAFKCSIFDCFSIKQELEELFKDLVRNEILELHVMGVDSDKKFLEVDLLRVIEGAYTSVRDCLVYGGKAVFEKNPYVT